ncbi:zinc transporter ZIP3-like isoform X2 [Lutzomyia longipalpis]|nr:zinc transporter ZIP3-like isoform X2 [Lutzomyia longipalpis]XP_055690387.1 zinc transporter ZIP3-like isoform X2 [Lutzomyia longipalpis]
MDVREGDDQHGDDVDGVIVAKATAMVILFLASLLFGLVPFKLAKWCKWVDQDTGRKSKTGKTIGALLCFGGGVLLATTFLHLLPEVGDNIKALEDQGLLPEFPFHAAEFLMCLGFFLMCLIEEIIHMYLRRSQRQSCAKNTAVATETAFERASRRSFRNGSISTTDLVSSTDSITQKQQITGLDSVHAQIPTGHTHLHGHTHLPQASTEPEDIIVSSLRGLLVVLALSVHELFEGLAVGLESSASNVWYMFGAVAAHKLVLAFCVGVELVVTRTRTYLAAIYVVTFAAVSPIGIGIGIGVSAAGDASSSSVPAAILQGLATGTLLYVIFFEILSKDRSGFIRYLATILGFALMFGLQFLTGHEHSHGDDGHGHSHSRNGRAMVHKK